MADDKNIDLRDFDEEDFNTIVEGDIRFSGTIRFSKPFLIKGFVSGNIDASGDLVVDTDASVEADIKVRRLLVRGNIEGNITADTIIHVTSTGSIVGNIESRQVILEDGSFFSGKCEMHHPRRNAGV
ncbi:MAG: polymer-forming cytoskeletal protein [Spirochaetaceae bacterium]|nr:polymer-forming cytoskeletal protein [Spirochaetaceae bacterium]